MSDDTPIGQPMDWETAQMHAHRLVNEYRSMVVLDDVIATALQARNWIGQSKQEIEGLQREIAKLKEDRTAATQAATTAKRVQHAAEESARMAAAEAKSAEEQSGGRIRSAQNAQNGRVAELEAAIEGRRRVLESDMTARKAALDEQIGERQKTLSEVTAQIEALRNRL